MPLSLSHQKKRPALVKRRSLFLMALLLLYHYLRYPHECRVNIRRTGG
jgi:hypothetical protein